MKKFLCTLLILASSYSISSFANHEELSKNDTYVSSKDILIGDNGIFVNVNGQVIRAQNLHYDDQGFQIVEDKETWYCSKCNKHRVRYPCYVCGKKGPDNPW